LPDEVAWGDAPEAGDFDGVTDRVAEAEGPGEALAWMPEAEGDAFATGVEVSGDPEEMKISTPVATATTATTPAAAKVIFRRFRLRSSRRLASSRRMAARIRFTFRCDIGHSRDRSPRRCRPSP